jgi:hypothetical protein
MEEMDYQAFQARRVSQSISYKRTGHVQWVGERGTLKGVIFRKYISVQMEVLVS